jgi:hypothetical protein
LCLERKPVPRQNPSCIGEGGGFATLFSRNKGSFWWG